MVKEPKNFRKKEAFMDTSRKTINVVAALIRDEKKFLPQPEAMGIIKVGGNFRAEKLNLEKALKML